MLDELLRTAQASPHDDAPLLVLADQLLERGNTHGELIHLQCNRPRLPLEHPERASLEAREKALIATDGAKWLGSAWHPLIEFEFVRGVPTGRFGHNGIWLSQINEPTSQHPSRIALRVYPYGWAFSAAVVAHENVEKQLATWLTDKHANLSRGAVVAEWKGDQLHLAFDLTASYGTVKYQGVFRDGGIDYESHSLINGYRGTGRFTIAPVEGCDTRPSFVKPDESTWDGQHDGHY